MSFSRPRPRPALARIPARAGRARLRLETLEDRTVPYALTGYKWANPDVSFSFVPDGTPAEGSTSSLFRLLNATTPTATWQREAARALQTWANVSQLNVRLVADDGSPTGTAGSPQGDSRFGDIRLGAAPEGSYLAYAYYPAGTVLGGDVFLNPMYAFHVGATYDVYSVLLHEFGHSLGLGHSSGAVMNASYMGVLTGLTADDVAGIQAIYGTRRADAYDAAAANDTLGAATALGTDAAGLAAASADLTTRADVDYYRLTVPAGGDGTLAVTLDARAVSLLAPRVLVYDVNGVLVASAEAGYNGTATVQLSGLVAGATYYVVADGATTDEFGQGAYRLAARFGGLSGSGDDTGDTGGGDLLPDRYESNETAATARGLGSVNSTSQTGLTVHAAADLDYFAFTAKTSAKYIVRTTFTGAAGNLDLAVYDANQNLIGSSTGTGDGDVVTLSLTGGRRYYVKVFGADGATNTYGLAIAKQGGKTTGLRRAGPPGAPADVGHGTYPDGSHEDHDHDHHREGESGPAGFDPRPAEAAARAPVSVEGLRPVQPFGLTAVAPPPIYVGSAAAPRPRGPKAAPLLGTDQAGRAGGQLRAETEGTRADDRLAGWAADFGWVRF